MFRLCTDDPNNPLDPHLLLPLTAAPTLTPRCLWQRGRTSRNCKQVGTHILLSLCSPYPGTFNAFPFFPKISLICFLLLLAKTTNLTLRIYFSHRKTQLTKTCFRTSDFQRFIYTGNLYSFPSPLLIANMIRTEQKELNQFPLQIPQVSELHNSYCLLSCLEGWQQK